MKSIYWLLGTIVALQAPFAYAQVESNFSSGGGVKIGWSNTNCDGAIEGALRYNSTSGGSVDFCHSGTWRNVGSGGGGSAANPDRGIQFNSGGSFAAASSFLYTSTGRLGLGTATPSYTLSLTGTGSAQSIGMENETTAATAGRDLNIYAGGALSGTSINGGNIVLNSGRTTGHGSSSVQFYTVMPGQGNNTTVRNPALSMTVSSNAITVPSGTNAQRPGQSNMQAAANGMIRYNTTGNKFEAYQAGAWVDMIGGSAASPTRSIQFNNGGAFAGDANFVYTATSRVGIGTGTPVAKLDVEGAVQVGNNSETCAAATDRGNIRYNGSIIQVCNDHAIGWENMAVGASIVADELCNSSKTYSAPGIHAYKVPAGFQTLTIRLWGGGGAGGSASSNPSIFSGSPGQATGISSLFVSAGGGAGGTGGSSTTLGVGGAGGTAMGGDTALNGNPGGNGVSGGNPGAGANAPGFGGGTGGAPSYDGNPGGAPGAGGAGASASFNTSRGGGGGSGAYIEMVLTPSDIAAETIISDINVGAGGLTNASVPTEGKGGNGQVMFICSTVPGGIDPGTLLGDLGDVTITSPTNGQALTYNGTNWVNSAGGGAAAGSNTQIQFNSGGSAFGGSANLTWNQSTSKLTITGDIEYTGVTTDISDQRLKDNIQPLPPALTQIMSMTPVSFTMKADPHHATEYGFIAQEIEKIYPVLVKTADDAEQTKSMNYTGLIAPLVKALQEQQKIIENQRIEALEKAAAPNNKK